VNRVALAAAVLGAAGMGITALAAAQAPSRSVQDGVYTVAQATRGGALYEDKCASCHGATTDITPGMAPLLGDYVFQDTWKGRSVGDLFERILNTMPQSAPGTLSPQETAEIIAHILSANRAPAGDVTLADAVAPLKQIQMSW